MNWTAILANANIPEPPGYQELFTQLQQEKQQQPVEQPKPKGKRK